MNKHVTYTEDLKDDGDTMTLGELREALDPSGQHIALIFTGGPDKSLIIGARGPMFRRVLEALTNAGLINPRKIMSELGILNEPPQ